MKDDEQCSPQVPNIQEATSGDHPGPLQVWDIEHLQGTGATHAHAHAHAWSLVHVHANNCMHANIHEPAPAHANIAHTNLISGLAEA